MKGLSPKSLAAAKVKRQKQIVAVGSVILLALLGYQLPKLLGGGSSAAPAAPLSSLPSASGTPPAAGKLPNTDRIVIDPEPGPGQLLSFGLFKSKDPFVQQLTTLPPTATTPGATTTTPAPGDPTGTGPIVPPATTTSPTDTGTTTATTTTTGTSPSETTPTAPPPPPTSVAISTNGVCQTVALQGTFPSSENIFRVVWIARDGKSVKVAVVGGSYDSGQAAATLKMGERLTLVNTADGTRYVLSLRAACEGEPPPSTTTTTSTPAPPVPTTTTAPTTTATTPIVTDSLDTTTVSTTTVSD